MKEAAEYEKVSFINVSETNTSKSRPVEIKRDLSRNYKKRLRNPVLLTICDQFLAATVVIANVVGFWRGLFGLFSHFQDLYHLFFLYLLGSLIIFHFTLSRGAYKAHLLKDTKCSAVLRKAYTYVFGCACVAQWAGLWFFLDEMSGFDVYPPLTYSVICSAILVCIKLYRNVLAPPVTVSTDQLDEFFEFSTVLNAHLETHKERLRMRSEKSKSGANAIGYNHVLSVLDAVLSGVLIAPGVIAYWRGTWYLSDAFVFPSNLQLSLIVSTVVGALVQLIFSLWQETLQRAFNPDRHRILFYVTSRLYSYLYSIACVNLWRGGWNALDFYSGTDPVQVTIPTVISLAVLVGMKTMRNLSSAPLAVVFDAPHGYFQVPTMFKLTGSSDTSLYVLDCFFSVFVIGSLVVFVWRGVWCLTDVFLYPDNDKFSAFGSLAIGYIIIIIVFSIQLPMENLCEKLTGFWRLLVADLYVFVSFIGTINLWRGIWNLLNIYFLPETPLLSFWITHLGSFAFLVLLNCSNSTLVRGVYLDGDEGGKCVVFPVSYLRLIFKKRSEGNEKKISGDAEKGPKENSENGKTSAPVQGT